MFDNLITNLTAKYIANQDLILILVLLFVFVMVYSLLSYTHLFKDNKKINAVVSVCVAFMTVFFMKENWIIYSYILPFRTLTLILFYVLPLIIILGIAHGSHMSSFGRKLMLVIFLIMQTLILFKDTTNFSLEENKQKFTLLGITILLIILDTPLNKLVKSIKSKS